MNNNNQSSLTLVYADSTGLGSFMIIQQVYIRFYSRLGGTTSTSGNFKIHTFNSSSNFVVSSISNGNQSHTEVSYVVALRRWCRR